MVSSGRGAFHTGLKLDRKAGGLYGSEYDGMSNDKTGEKPVRRKSKVS